MVSGHTEFQRALEIRRSERVVNDDDGVWYLASRQRHHSLDVDELEGRIRRRLNPDQLGVALDLFLGGREVKHVGERCLNSHSAGTESEESVSTAVYVILENTRPVHLKTDT